MERHIKYIIIHCSATSPAQKYGPKNVDLDHRRLGWLQGGYHFYILRNGDITSGRPLGMTGAHTNGHNHNSIGICLFGGVNNVREKKPQDNFTENQKKALETLLRELIGHFPDTIILGHNHFDSQKACPVLDVNEFLADRGLP